ncbi:MAG TPA: alpha/beta fold hydrolase [Gemmataceae bacterium]|nr:alpha/beta fold hydrolase [Gemmataceae bacterium]
MRSIFLLLILAAPAVTADPPRRFKATTEKDAVAWQEESRKFLTEALKLEGLPGDKSVAAVPFAEKVLSTSKLEEFTLYELELNASRGRRMKAVFTVPLAEDGKKKFPAVVCIHGHGGHRFIVYDPLSLYRGFATDLARRGYVTISVDVGQHNVYEEGRTLMGERLWDLVRCVNYLVTRKEVDAERLGCAGLSLGGEMAMWLGAMDPRIKATVSSGFLTTVANMRMGHCPCWEFKGFSENFDFADVYGLIAPRALLCQIGREERAPGGFPVDVAESAMVDVRKVYAAFGKKDKPVLDLHPGGHVYVNKTTIQFLDSELKP